MSTAHSHTLVLARLTTRSTYAANSQQPADGNSHDTVQFWLGPDDGWRIRTFAVDHDLHVHHLAEFSTEAGDRLQILHNHIFRMYDDILEGIYVLEFKDAADEAEVAKVLTENELAGALEHAEAGFAFYNPDAGKYRTQTESL